jgi:methylglutaconyl-CoA hydratase
MEGYINQSKKDSVLTIEFGHPSHNSLTSSLFKELAATITDAEVHEDIKAILLKSGGERTFCAGASFNELSQLKNEAEATSFFSSVSTLLNAMKNSSKIIVGRVHGKAVGGGMGIIAACDYAIASKYASVRLSELYMGIGPFVIGPYVEHKIGKAHFTHMSLNPTEWQTASWAKDKGLYAESFDTVAQMDDYINHFLNNLNSYSSHALKALKKIFWEGCDHFDTLLTERAKISASLALREEAQASIRNFLTSDNK